MSNKYTISQLTYRLGLNEKKKQSIRVISKYLNIGKKVENGYRIFDDNDIKILSDFLDYKNKNKSKLSQKEILISFKNKIEKVIKNDNENTIETHVNNDIEGLKSIIESSISEKITLELNRIFDISKIAILKSEELGEYKAILKIKENEVIFLNEKMLIIEKNLKNSEKLNDAYKQKIDELKKQLDNERNKSPISKLFNLKP